MTLLQRLTREPALLIGVVTSGLGLAVLFGVSLTQEQLGGIVAFLGATMALVRFLTTPNAEVVAQEKPDGTVVAGPAADVVTGHVIAVDVTPVDTDLRG